MSVKTAVLYIVDEDEMSETLDRLSFDPFSPFHVVLKNGTVTAGELVLVLVS